MSESSRSPVDEYVNWMRTSEQLKARTQRVYETHLRRLETHCSTNGLRIEDLSEMELRSYLAPFQLDRSPQPRLTALRRFYSFQEAQGYRDDNPMAAIRPPARKRSESRSRGRGLAAKIQRLSPRDQLVAHFIRELRDPTATEDEIFSIRPLRRVGASVTVTDAEGRERPLALTDQARQLLGEIDGELPTLRTFQRHLNKVGLTVTALLAGSDAEVSVEMQPALEELIHSQMARRDYVAAATDAFIHIDDQLRDLVGQRRHGRGAIDLALGDDGILAGAFERDDERWALRNLLSGAFGYYRNRLAHNQVLFADPMHGREVVLLCDLLLRELDEVSRDVQIERLEETPRSERDAQMKEHDVRKLSHSEFEKWVVRWFRGTYATHSSDVLGIDGFTARRVPIQVKQQERVGLETVDKFETAVERASQTHGILVAYSFTRRARDEATRSSKSGRAEVRLVTVEDLIHNRVDQEGRKLA